MTEINSSEYQYKVGGSLSADDPSYVSRKADQELLNALQLGEFCYVLSSRQVGKSSLRVKTIQLLRCQGFACASIDLAKLGSHDVTIAKWYNGLILELAREFKILEEFDLKSWRYQHQEISVVQMLAIFIEDVLLNKISNKKIFIFIDEIDTTLSLRFSTDDFFALIRSCYEQRASNSNFSRLTFCLFGVATPSDLVADEKRTPFNIGRAISLNGFSFQEAKVLETGIQAKAANPHQVLQKVLSWTGGQPFLTQKVFNLILKDSIFISEGAEKEYIKKLVYFSLIENWESKDTLAHLKTIRDRILNDSKYSLRFLELYREILEKGEIETSGGVEQVKIQLSGLIIEIQGKLKAYNHIYELIFDKSWTEKSVMALRPYAEELSAWLKSDCKDVSTLLKGTALKNAWIWAEGKSLSSQDYRFLTASREIERTQEEFKIHRKLELQKQESQILAEAYEDANRIRNEAEKKAKKLIRIGFYSLFFMLSMSIITFSKMKIVSINSQLINRSISSESLFKANSDLVSILEILRTATQLRKLEKWGIVGFDTKIKVVTTLREIAYGIKEKNRLEVHKDFTNWRVTFSPDGQFLLSTGDDKVVRLWNRNGLLIREFLGHKDEIWKAEFSPDSQRVLSASRDGIIKLWDRDGKLIKTLESHAMDAVSGAQQFSTPTSSFSPDGQLLVSGSDNGTLKIWNRDGKLIKTLVQHTAKVTSIAFSPDGELFATTSNDQTVNLWNRNGTLKRTLRGHFDIVNSVVFSPDGHTLATGSDDKTARLWNLDGILETKVLRHHDKVWAISFSSNGQVIASGGSDKMVRLWSQSGEALANLPTDDSSILSLGFHPKDQNVIAATESNAIYVWKLDGTPIEHIGRLGKISATSISFSPDYETIATTNYDGAVRLWNFRKSFSDVLKEHSSTVLDVSFSPNGQNLLTTSWDGSVKLLRRDGYLLETIPLPNKGDNTWPAAFSPDGQTFVTDGKNNTINFWKWDGTFLKNSMKHDAVILAVCFSPDGDMFVTADFNGIIRIWERNGKLLKLFQAHKDFIGHVTFSPDGQTIATSGQDKTVKLGSTSSAEKGKMIMGLNV